MAQLVRFTSASKYVQSDPTELYIYIYMHLAMPDRWPLATHVRESCHLQPVNVRFICSLTFLPKKHTRCRDKSGNFGPADIVYGGYVNTEGELSDNTAGRQCVSSAGVTFVQLLEEGQPPTHTHIIHT